MEKVTISEFLELYEAAVVSNVITAGKYILATVNEGKANSRCIWVELP